VKGILLNGKKVVSSAALQARCRGLGVIEGMA
jgi:hypothetical protein